MLKTLSSIRTLFALVSPRSALRTVLALVSPPSRYLCHLRL